MKTFNALTEMKNTFLFKVHANKVPLKACREEAYKLIKYSYEQVYTCFVDLIFGKLYLFN